MGGVDLIGQVALGQVLGALDQARQLGQHPRQSDEGTDGQQGHKYTDLKAARRHAYNPERCDDTAPPQHTRPHDAHARCHLAQTAPDVSAYALDPAQYPLDARAFPLERPRLVRDLTRSVLRLLRKSVHGLLGLVAVQHQHKSGVLVPLVQFGLLERSVYCLLNRSHHLCGLLLVVLLALALGKQINRIADIKGKGGAPQAVCLDAHGQRPQDEEAYQYERPDQYRGQRQQKINAVRRVADHNLCRIYGGVSRSGVRIVEAFPDELERTVGDKQQNTQQNHRPAVEKPQADAVLLGLVCPMTGRKQQVEPQQHTQHSRRCRTWQQSHRRHAAHKPIAGQIPTQCVIFHRERAVKSNVNARRLSVRLLAAGRGDQDAIFIDPVAAQRGQRSGHLPVAVYTHHAHTHIAALRRILTFEHGHLLFFISHVAV